MQIFLDMFIQQRKIMLLTVTRRINNNGKDKEGGFDNLLNYIRIYEKNIWQINLPLTKSDHYTFVKFLDNNQKREYKFSKFQNYIPFFLRIAILDSFILFTSLALIFAFRGKIKVYSADTYSSFVLKLFYEFGLIKCWLQHIPDYRPLEFRFNNKVIDYIYKKSLVLTYTVPDCVTTPNEKIDKALKLEVGLSPKRCIVISNVFKPIRRQIGSVMPPRYLCMPSQIDENSLLIEMIPILKSYLISTGGILVVVGDTKKKEYIKKLKERILELEIEKHVTFVGMLNQQELSRILNEVQVGIALYRGDQKYNFNQYGDSLKIRQFAAYGIPVIGTRSISPMSELEGAGGGFGVDSVIELEIIVQKLLSPVAYKKICKLSSKWANENWEQYKLKANEVLKMLDIII
jgi:glycosyltransferase involved in cell wall biosynthesis